MSCPKRHKYSIFRNISQASKRIFMLSGFVPFIAWSFALWSNRSLLGEKRSSEGRERNLSSVVEENRHYLNSPHLCGIFCSSKFKLAISLHKLDFSLIQSNVTTYIKISTKHFEGILWNTIIYSFLLIDFLSKKKKSFMIHLLKGN